MTSTDDVVIGIEQALRTSPPHALLDTLHARLRSDWRDRHRTAARLQAQRAATGHRLPETAAPLAIRTTTAGGVPPQRVCSNPPAIDGWWPTCGGGAR
ncbi:hypothetical protein K7G98_19090 [Saccharothrix sp. MB29]|nr:hypothetical protein [Saccharothrix sp. MB29]